MNLKKENVLSTNYIYINGGGAQTSCNQYSGVICSQIQCQTILSIKLSIIIVRDICRVCSVIFYLKQ